MKVPGTWPIRWRLTALNVAALAATLLGLGGLFLLQLDGALLGITADHLRDQAQPVLQRELGPRPAPPAKPEAKVAPGKPNGGPTLERMGPEPGSPIPRKPEGSPPFGLDRAANAFLRELAGRDTGVLVFDREGALVAASAAGEGLEGWPLPPADLLSGALAGAEGTAVVPQESRRSLVLLLPLRTADGTVVGVLGLANALDLVDQFGTGLRRSLVLGAVLAVLVAGGLGVRATRSALRPLERMVLAIRRIGADRLDERLRFDRHDEIGELADAFDRMLDRLEGVFAAQRRFVADAAHELRTPLTALGGAIEVLRLGADQGDPATERRMLATMGREVDRLTRLVNDLLTLSRLDDARPPPPTTVALGPLVEDVYQQARLLATDQDVTLRFDASPTVPGSEDELKQVVLNVVDNALAFTPPGGGIELALIQGGTCAQIAVRDTGPGIGPEDLPRVFDRFYRGDKSRARRRDASGARRGAGLGLAIAHRIVEAHGGTIDVASAPGAGTTVTITLPLAQSAAGAPSGGRPGPASTAIATPGSGSAPTPPSGR